MAEYDKKDCFSIPFLLLRDITTALADAAEAQEKLKTVYGTLRSPADFAACNDRLDRLRRIEKELTEIVENAKRNN